MEEVGSSRKRMLPLGPEKLREGAVTLVERSEEPTALSRTRGSSTAVPRETWSPACRAWPLADV